MRSEYDFSGGVRGKYAGKITRRRLIPPSDLKVGTQVEICYKANLYIRCVVSFHDLVKHEVRFYSPENSYVLACRYDQHEAFYDGDGRTLLVYERIQ